jgi:ribosomal-protein-alanine N-acetyltransferase
MFPERLTTDRLELEQCRRETVDVLDLYDVCSAPEMDRVTRYMPWGRHETPRETAAFLDEVAAKWDDEEVATYVVRPKPGEDGAGEIAGTTALTCDWDRRAGKLGLWLRERFWGRGYSGERALALADLAFDELDLELLEVAHHADNENSERAIEKYVEAMGGRREGLLRGYRAQGDGAVDAVRYTATREEYRESV